MTSTLTGSKVAFLFTHGVEQIELTAPLEALRQAGAQTTLVSLEPGEVQMFNHLDKSDTIVAEQACRRRASEYDALVLPGGVANPDRLRTDPAAVHFVRDFFQHDKPVGVICHGPGRSSRPTWSKGARSPHGRAWRPTCATPAPNGSTSRCTLTGGSCQAASRTTSRRSAKSWSK